MIISCYLYLSILLFANVTVTNIIFWCQTVFVITWYLLNWNICFQQKHALIPFSVADLAKCRITLRCWMKLTPDQFLMGTHSYKLTNASMQQCIDFFQANSMPIWISSLMNIVEKDFWDCRGQSWCDPPPEVQDPPSVNITQDSCADEYHHNRH